MKSCVSLRCAYGKTIAEHQEAVGFRVYFGLLILLRKKTTSSFSHGAHTYILVLYCVVLLRFRCDKANGSGGSHHLKHTLVLTTPRKQ